MPHIFSRIGTFALAATLGGTPLLGAQALSPAGSALPAGAAVADSVLSALNAGAPAARAFVEARLVATTPAASRDAMFRTLDRLVADGAPFTTSAVEEQGRHVMLTLSSAKAHRLVLLDLARDRADLSRLRLVDVLKSWNPDADRVEWPTTSVDPAQVPTIVDRNLRMLERAGAFTGAVLVARGDSVVYEGAFGSADRASATPLSAHSRFTLASVGKMFTAVAIAQLVEAGKLSLDDTLAKVLPEYPKPDVARRITIRQLLEHRAGLGTLFDDPRLQRGVSYPTQLALASAVAPDTLRFAPGTSWAYSNEGFVVLAAVVERVSGTDFFTYLHDHVFVPAGMTETIFAASIDSVPDRVIGYRSADGDPLGVRPAVRSALSIAGSASGAGGGYSTARDLFRFARALATGRLLSPAMRDTITMGRTPLPWERSTLYGYGFERHTGNANEFYGHGGGGTNAGIDNDVRISADGSWTVIVLSNMDPPAGATVAKGVAGMVPR